MSPTPKDLEVICGDRVRVKPEFLPTGSNRMEVFSVKECPAHGGGGAVVLVGRLNGQIINMTADTDGLTEKVK